MPLQAGDIEKSFQEVIASMEEGIEYEFLPETFQKINDFRKKRNYQQLKSFVFKKEKNNLFFDWQQNNWDKSIIDHTNGVFAFAFPFVAFPFTLAFAFAFAENQIRKVKSDYDGREVEIEGVKYQLQKI